jgi:hypothetical protein
MFRHQLNRKKQAGAEVQNSFLRNDADLVFLQKKNHFLSPKFFSRSQDGNGSRELHKMKTKAVTDPSRRRSSFPITPKKLAQKMST